MKTLAGKVFDRVLASRLEHVVAVAVSGTLLTFCLATRAFRAFSLGMQDYIFILLPVGILCVKAALGLLATPESGDAKDTWEFFASFFRPFVKIFKDWFPFLLLSACYYSLFTNFVLRINPHTADGTLVSFEIALLGKPVALLLEPVIRPWLTEFLNLIYFSFVLLLPGVVLYFYLVKQERAFRRIMMGYLTLILMGVTSYVLVPAAGPDTFLAENFSRDLNGNALSKGIDFIIREARVGYDCFPSLHVAIPLLIALYLREYRPKAWYPALGYVLLMCLATLYLRYHYAVDVIASFVYAPVAYRLNDAILAWWPGEKCRPNHATAALPPASQTASLTPTT